MPNVVYRDLQLVLMKVKGFLASIRIKYPLICKEHIANYICKV